MSNGKRNRNVYIQEPTAFMIWLEMDWKKSRLRQPEYCQSIGIVDMDAFGRQTLSKVIRGRTRNIPPMLLDALSINRGIPRDDLIEMHREKSPSPVPKEAVGSAVASSSRLADLATRARELEADASLYKWLHLNREDRNLQHLLSNFHRIGLELKALGLLKEE